MSDLAYRQGVGVSPGGSPASPSPPFPAEKVTSLGKDWHRPCLRCERCGKTLTPGGHAEVRAGAGVWGGTAGGCCPPAARGEACRCRAWASTEARGAWASTQRAAGRGFEILKAAAGRGVCGGGRCGTRRPPPFRPQHDGQPYCHKPCYGILFGPKGECRQEGWGWGAPPRPAPRHLAASPRRSEHWSRGQLHLRQRPRGQSSALGRGPVRLPPACSGARCSAPGAAAAQPGPARPACRPRARCRGWRPACPRLLLWPPLALLCPHGLCPSSVCLVSLCARGPGGSPWGGHPTLPLSRPQACPTVLLLLPLPVTATATLFTVFPGGH